MTNIIWLASYPKSGNTWLRAFLLNYMKDPEAPPTLSDLTEFAISDMRAGPFEESIGKSIDGMPLNELLANRLKFHAHIAKVHEGSALVKTHSNFRLSDRSLAINLEVTRSAIYVVRNPLDMIVSFADHYGCGIDGAIAASASTNHHIGSDAGRVPLYVGTWSSHVAGWLSPSELPRLLLRYEDISRDATRAFRQVVQFLKLELDEDRLQRAIERATFNSLKSMEYSEGFAEKSPNSETFFRSGRIGGWQSKLSKKQVSEIIKLHGPVMKKLGYLKDGAPTF